MNDIRSSPFPFDERDPGQTEGPRPDEPSHGQESWLTRVQRVWRHYRLVIVTTAASVLLGYCLATAAAAALSRVDITGTMEFQLLFEGATEGRFPSGASFDADDIISTPVLDEVYDANGLADAWDYWRFRNAFALAPSSREHDIVAADFRARLSDPRLTPLDRSRIADEFRERSASALSTPRYTLTFRQHSRFRALPAPLVAKLLRDTLVTWADMADQKTDAVRRNLGVYSRDLIRSEQTLEQDYLVAVDIVRGQITRLIRNAEELALVPGSSLVSVGEHNVSIGELRARFEDLQRLRLPQLLSTVRSARLVRNPEQLRSHISSRVLQTDLEWRQTAGRVDALQQSLREYTERPTDPGFPRPRTPESPAMESGQGATGGPRAGLSFLDRLFELSTRGEDLEYRQGLTDRIVREGIALAALERERAYYDDLTRTAGLLAGSRPSPPSGASRYFDETLGGILAELEQASVDMDAIHRELSALHLHPPTLLYSADPVVVSRSQFMSWRRAFVGMVLCVSLAAFVALGGCLVHDRLAALKDRS